MNYLEDYKYLLFILQENNLTCFLSKKISVCTNTIRSSIYEEGIMRLMLNYLTGNMYVDILPPFSPVLYRQVNVRYLNADFVNLQSLYKALTTQVNIELQRKYPLLQRERRRVLEKITTRQENVKSRIYRLPLNIVNYEICQYL